MNANLARGVGNWDLIKRTPPIPSPEGLLYQQTNKQTPPLRKGRKVFGCKSYLCCLLFFSFQFLPRRLKCAVYFPADVLNASPMSSSSNICRGASPGAGDPGPASADRSMQASSRWRCSSLPATSTNQSRIYLHTLADDLRDLSILTSSETLLPNSILVTVFMLLRHLSTFSYDKNPIRQ